MTPAPSRWRRVADKMLLVGVMIVSAIVAIAVMGLLIDLLVRVF